MIGAQALASSRPEARNDPRRVGLRGRAPGPSSPLSHGHLVGPEGETFDPIVAPWTRNDPRQHWRGPSPVHAGTTVGIGEADQRAVGPLCLSRATTPLWASGGSLRGSAAGGLPSPIGTESHQRLALFVAFAEPGRPPASSGAQARWVDSARERHMSGSTRSDLASPALGRTAAGPPRRSCPR